MATGPTLVNTQQIEDGPSTSISIDSNYDDALNQSDSRRNSMVFRSSRQQSSSEEDDEIDFSAELNEIRKRRYSMDLHRTKNRLFANSYSEHPNKMQRANTEDNTSFIKTIDTQFTAPLIKKQASRPNSPSPSSRPLAVASKRRLATIRRESDCSLENLTSNEFAHERLVKDSQRVSMGFDGFCLDEKMAEERKRAKSLVEPISVFTNAFLPQSSSPSPKAVDIQKQCYSPSTNQIVRGNIPYSTPSPTPSSPRTRIMRSMSPISVRQISKRRFTANSSGMESDSENSTSQSGQPLKRQCLIPQRSAASPLVRDSLSIQSMDGQLDRFDAAPLSPAISVCSNSSSIYNNLSRPRFVTDMSSTQSDAQSSFVDDNNSVSGELPDQPNENSSTAFSSRAPTPFDEQMNEETDNSTIFPTSQSSPMRQGVYNTSFSVFGKDSSLPPPSPLASKSLSMGDCN